MENWNQSQTFFIWIPELAVRIPAFTELLTPVIESSRLGYLQLFP